MCFYITSVLPENVKLEELRPIFNKYNMSFVPIVNPYVQEQLKKGEMYFQATNDYCDCDTYLGMLDTSEAYKKLLGSSKVRKLRNKKWTELQIDEWIKNKLTDVNPKFKKLTEVEKRIKYERWEGLLKSLLTEKNVDRVGILKHWYSKNLENEEIRIIKRRIVKFAEVCEDFLLHLKEDVLYDFRV